MNQILQVKKQNKTDNSGNIKEIIVFFTIVIVIFCFIYGAYLICKNIFENGKQPPTDVNNIDTPKYVPTITLMQNERDKVTIDIESEIGISKIEYYWNNEQHQIIELEGKNNIQKIIEMPLGENVINIFVTDINGEIHEKQQTFIYELPKPTIELAVVGDEIKLTITSEEELAQVKYSWNSENEKIDDMKTYTNKNNFEKKLKIPVGQNVLKIVATDIKGSITEKEQEIKGITKATTTTKEENGYLHFTVTGKENIKTVEFEFNGKKYLMNTDTFGTTKVVHYKMKLINGINYLTVTSTTESGGVDTTSIQHQYTTD